MKKKNGHMLEILVAGFVIGLTHAIPPGPITFEVLRRGITSGFRPALQINIGAIAADVVFFVVIAFGLAQVVNNGTIKLVICIGGCALLCFLGLRGMYAGLIDQASYNIEKDTVKNEPDPLQAGFLICITSPFAIMWWAGVFAGAMGASLLNSQWTGLSLMFVGIALACFLWYAAIGVISASGRRLFNERHTRAMSIACSIIMLAFAVILFCRGYTTLL
jgi:L-lysine exporter family protein LysE/ArgO